MEFINHESVKGILEGRNVLNPANPVRQGVKPSVHATEHHEWHENEGGEDRRQSRLLKKSANKEPKRISNNTANHKSKN